MAHQEIRTFGDVRRVLVETIVGLRDGSVESGRGMAIAAAAKVLNDNVMAEVAATKLALQTEGRAHSFGGVVAMGQRLIASDLSGGPEQS